MGSEEELKRFLIALERGDAAYAAELRNLAGVFEHRMDKYLRLARGRCLELGVDLSDRPLYGPYTGEFPLGADLFRGHGLIVGTTGAGKTMLAYANVRRFMENGVSALIPDFHGDFRGLNMLNPDKIVELSVQDLRVNPLGTLEGESREETIVRVARNMRESDYLRDTSLNIMLEEYLRLF